MPNQQTQTNTGRGKRRNSTASPRTTTSGAAAEQAPTSEALPGFTLLADPVAIAGGVDPERPPPSTTPEAPPAEAHEAPPAEATSPPVRSTTPRTPATAEAPPAPASNASRIDAATARRLAAEARERERASREALEATRRALAQRPSRGGDRATAEPEVQTDHITVERAAEPAREATRGTRSDHANDSARDRPSDRPASTSIAPPDDAGSGWARRTLVGRDAAPPSRAAAPRPREAAAAGASPHDAAWPDPAADDREVEATLAIARETTRGQKREIAALREKLAAREALLIELQDPTREREALEAVRRENEQVVTELRERLERSERERDRAAATREQLERALEERQAMIDARGAQLDALHDRLAAQDRALEAARREFALERERHTRTRELLGRLRETLLQAVPDEAVASLDSPTDRGPDPGETTRPTLAATNDPGLPSTASAAMSSVEAIRAEASPSVASPPNLEGSTTPDGARPERRNGATAPTDRGVRAMEPAPGRRPAVFAAWLDDQIRRRFGPMGIDRLADLLETPLARRARHDQAQSIVLIGRGAWHRAPAFAEDLVERTPGGFTLHVVDPDGEPRTPTLGFDSPLRDFVEGAAAPASPEALETLLDRLAPAAIVSHDFLTRHEDPDPWIDVLEAECHRACLLFVEGTGLGAIDAPAPMAAIGDRIWDLMPERYTRMPGTDRRLDSWLEAFGMRDTAPANALGQRLRERFRFELSGQFGFLATPFLCSPIAANFDPDASRDRRFLAQIADLDDRKIEAGLAPPLHLVALVDHLAKED